MDFRKTGCAFYFVGLWKDYASDDWAWPQPRAAPSLLAFLGLAPLRPQSTAEWERSQPMAAGARAKLAHTCNLLRKRGSNPRTEPWVADLAAGVGGSHPWPTATRVFSEHTRRGRG